MRVPQATVIIPSYKSSQTLPKCLESVVNQHTQLPYDVIVVHSGPEPISGAVRSEFGSVTFHVSEERWLPGRARNFGLRYAESDWVLFLDADCVVEPDWIENMLSDAVSNDVTGIGGGISNATPWSFTSWVLHLLEFGEWLPKGPDRSCDNFPSCNAIYKRSALVQVGGFSEHVFPCEDTILNFLLREKGYDLLFCPDHTVAHIQSKGLRDLLRHNYAMGLTYGYACRNHELPGHFLVRMNPMMIFLLVIPVRLFRSLLRLFPEFVYLLPLFVLVSPMTLLALVAWGLGFAKASKNDIRPHQHLYSLPDS